MVVNSRLNFAIDFNLSRLLFWTMFLQASIFHDTMLFETMDLIAGLSTHAKQIVKIIDQN